MSAIYKGSSLVDQRVVNCVGLTTNTFDIRLKCEALLILLYSRSSMIIWPGAVGSNKTICSNNSGDSDPGQNPTQNQERETTNTCGSSVHTVETRAILELVFTYLKETNSSAPRSCY